MNRRIIGSIKNLLIDEKINLFKEHLNEIDNNFYSEDDYSDEYYKEETNITYSENEYDENYNKFYYVICLIAKNENQFNNIDCIEYFLLKNIVDKLNIEKKNIFLSFNNRRNFIETFIKTKKFAFSSINYIKSIITNTL